MIVLRLQGRKEGKARREGRNEKEEEEEEEAPTLPSSGSSDAAESRLCLSWNPKMSPQRGRDGKGTRVGPKIEFVRRGIPLNPENDSLKNTATVKFTVFHKQILCDREIKSFASTETDGRFQAGIFALYFGKTCKNKDNTLASRLEGKCHT